MDEEFGPAYRKERRISGGELGRWRLKFLEEAYVERAVERANAVGVMLGIVARKPLLKLKGSGQNRIAVRYRMPSRRRTWPRAMNRWSLPTILSTYLLSTVRLARNAHRLPSVHAVAASGHPPGKPYTRPATVLAVE